VLVRTGQTLEDVVVTEERQCQIQNMIGDRFGCEARRVTKNDSAVCETLGVVRVKSSRTGSNNFD